MKEKLIDTCGKVWNELGARGECSSYDLSRALGVDEEVVSLALGWLAREDKIESSEDHRERMFSLVESEMEAFRSFYGDGNVPVKKRSIWNRLFR